MKLSWHRRCPKCGGRRVTRRYRVYRCERCQHDFEGKKIGLQPLVVRIAFTFR